MIGDIRFTIIGVLGRYAGLYGKGMLQNELVVLMTMNKSRYSGSNLIKYMDSIFSG